MFTISSLLDDVTPEAPPTSSFVDALSISLHSLGLLSSFLGLGGKRGGRDETRREEGTRRKGDKKTGEEKRILELIRALERARDGDSDGAGTELYAALSDSLPSLLSVRDFDRQDWRETNASTFPFSPSLSPPSSFLRVSDLPYSFLPKRRKEEGEEIGQKGLLGVKYEVSQRSRLEILNGTLPYLSCKVRRYTPSDVETCLAARRQSGTPALWFAFVGDSKVRVRFERFIGSTLRDWRLTVAGQPVSWHNYTEVFVARKIQTTIDARSEGTGMRATVVWASRGMVSGPYNDLRQTEMLGDWMADDAKVPDVVVVDFGRWVYRGALIQGLDSLAAPDEVGRRWKAMWPLIAHLAARTRVLLLPQMRHRRHSRHTDARPPPTNPRALTQWQRDVTHDSVQGDQAADWIDRIAQRTARATGALLWDSSLPANLANGRECRTLRKGRQQDTPGYGPEVLNCADTFHPSASTMRDEISMLLNLVCNGYVAGDDRGDLCCS